MLDKYEVNSFSDCLQNEESYSGNENEKSNLKSKKIYYIDNKKCSNNNCQPECIIIRNSNNNNISYYQSDSKNNYRGRKSLNQNVIQGEYNFTNRKKAGSLPPQNYIEEKFSYHYTNEEDNKEHIKNNKISPSNQRINVDPFLNQTYKEVPRRTIRSIQNQFDVERNDNFKVLSYRPEDNEDNESNSNMDGKSKIIQIFKKQDVGELFFSSKRAQSPPSSVGSRDKKQQKLLSYQTPTLKFQSFFGSFTNSKNPKNTCQSKSKDKQKKNQLEDFNIDKLIEIGDNYDNKLIPILSFGIKVKNIKNKMKNRTNLNKNRFENTQKSCDRILRHQKDDKNDQNDMIDIGKIYEQKKENMHKNINKINNNINHDINGNINSNKNWIRMSTSKNIIYHGQIKRKRNFQKNTKTLNNNAQNKDFINKNEINYNNEDPNINQNININNELNNNKNNRRIIISKMKRKTVKPNHKVLEYFHNNMNKPNENQNYHQKTPTKVIQNKKIDISINNNNKTNYSINNKINNYYNNNLERNNFINNCKMMSDKNVPQEEKTKKILLTEKEVIYNNNMIQKNKNIKNEGNEEENYKNRKYNKINNNINKQISKRTSDKHFIPKNYYGYDEVNNMEGAINNHSYFESVYSRKKGLQKIISIDKINH